MHVICCAVANVVVEQPALIKFGEPHIVVFAITVDPVACTVRHEAHEETMHCHLVHFRLTLFFVQERPRVATEDDAFGHVRLACEETFVP